MNSLAGKFGHPAWYRVNCDAFLNAGAGPGPFPQMRVGGPPYFPGAQQQAALAQMKALPLNLPVFSVSICGHLTE